MADKIASIVLLLCAIADAAVAILYLIDKRWYAAGYWAAAAIIVFCVLKGMR